MRTLGNRPDLFWQAQDVYKRQTWNIVMGVFDATQSVVNQSSGVIIG